jgi:hypothetical protein
VSWCDENSFNKDVKRCVNKDVLKYDEMSRQYFTVSFTSVCNLRLLNSTTICLSSESLNGSHDIVLCGGMTKSRWENAKIVLKEELQ